MSRVKKPAPLGFQFEDPEGRLRGPWAQIRGDLRKAWSCCWSSADLGYHEPKVHGLLPGIRVSDWGPRIWGGATAGADSQVLQG